jgi:broad specificity phosphatase PhoE
MPNQHASLPILRMVSQPDDEPDIPSSLGLVESIRAPLDPFRPPVFTWDTDHGQSRPCSFAIYVSRHGQSLANVGNIIGGDTALSPSGVAYSHRLCKFIKATAPQGCPVWTSCLQRTVQTAAPLKKKTVGVCKRGDLDQYPQTARRGLDEISAGICDGLTDADAVTTYPDVMLARKQDKLRYRYPRGESYLDLTERVAKECAELEAQCRRRCNDSSKTTSPWWVVSHQATLRCLIAYFTNVQAARTPYVEIPLHTVFKLAITFCPRTSRRLSCELSQVDV